MDLVPMATWKHLLWYLRALIRLCRQYFFCYYIVVEMHRDTPA